MNVTLLNLYALWSTIEANQGIVPPRVPATDATHLKRCVKANLLAPSPIGGKTLHVTDAGLEGLVEYQMMTSATDRDAGWIFREKAVRLALEAAVWETMPEDHKSIGDSGIRKIHDPNDARGGAAQRPLSWFGEQYLRTILGERWTGFAAMADPRPIVILPTSGIQGAKPPNAVQQFFQGRSVKLARARQTLHYEVLVYNNGRLAIELWTSGKASERWCVLTVNLVEQPDPGPGEIHVKTWDGNEEACAAVLAAGHFTDTGRRLRAGYPASVWRIGAPAHPDSEARVRFDAEQAKLPPAQRRTWDQSLADEQAAEGRALRRARD